MSADQEGRVIPFPDQQAAVEGANAPETPAETSEPGVVEAEFVDDEPAAVVPVDQPHEVIDLLPWQQPDDRRPIIPAALTKEHRGPAVRWYLGRYTHKARYHAVRLPWYAAKTALYSPRGAARIGRRVTEWVTVAEAQALKAMAVRHAQTSLAHLHEGHAIYHTAERVAAPKIRARRIVLGAAFALALISGLMLWFLAPSWAFPLAVAASVAALGYAGKPVDQPLIGPAVVSAQYTKLTSDLVDRALRAMGISALSAKDAGIEFPAPIVRDGLGWRAEVLLPLGVIAADVIEQREKLAGNLRRPLGCVWPEVASGEHPAWLVLWVGDQDMRKTKQPAWPLLKHGRVDLFEPVPWATDPRGRWITITLMFASMVIGAVPRVGKTFALRELLLIAALDPRVQIHGYELKGTGDLSPLECVLHRYICGSTNKKLAALLRSLRGLQEELERRTEVIEKLPADARPEFKVTPELADKRSLGLYPIVVGIDECHRAFEHPEFGAEMERIVTDLVKRGPALGIIVILATQRPDATSLPKGISDNAVLRFCLRVMGWQANDMVLGTGAHKAGIRATMFSREDRGIGIFAGEGDNPTIARTVVGLDGPASERVAKRARAMRDAAGTLSGYCIGEGDTDLGVPTVDLLDDLTVVYAQAERADRTGVWSQDLCSGLAELRPEVYAGWDPDTLAAALKPYAVRTVQLHMPDESGVRRTRYGLRRELLDQALAVRAERRKLEPS